MLTLVYRLVVLVDGRMLRRKGERALVCDRQRDNLAPEHRGEQSQRALQLLLDRKDMNLLQKLGLVVLLVRATIDNLA